MAKKKRDLNQNASDVTAPLTERQLIKAVRPRPALEKFQGKFERRLPISKRSGTTKPRVVNGTIATWSLFLSSRTLVD